MPALRPFIIVATVVTVAVAPARPAAQAATDASEIEQKLEQSAAAIKAAKRGSKRAGGDAPDAFSAVLAAREADSATARLRPELRAGWLNFLRERGLDEELDRETTTRLKEAYFDSIDEWAHAAESCEPDGVNRRWLPRLIKAVGKEDVLKQREDVARILGTLAADRLAECAQPAEEAALRAERELNSFVADRLRLISEYFDGLEQGSVRASTRSRVARLEKGLRTQRPLADRSVSVSSLRLKTAAAKADPEIVEQLENDPAFQKPFALGRALAQLNALNGNRDDAGKTALKAKPAAKKPAPEPDLRPRLAREDEKPKRRPPPEPEPHAIMSPSEPLTTPWLLQ